MPDTKTFRISDKITIQGICHEVGKYLENEYGLVINNSPISNGYLIHAVEKSNMKKVIGIGQAIDVEIVTVASSKIKVSIESGSWSDRGGVHALASAPLRLITSTFILTEVANKVIQARLPDKIFDCVAHYIDAGGLSKIKCYSCGTINPPGLKSCAYCGKLLE